MTKRFTYDFEDCDRHCIIDFQDKMKKYTLETVGDFEDVVGLLNTLHEENQELKHYKLYEDNKRLQTIIADLKEENEQLKADHKRQENQIKLLNKQLTKIPPKIREVWIE